MCIHWQKDVSKLYKKIIRNTLFSTCPQYNTIHNATSVDRNIKKVLQRGKLTQIQTPIIKQ